MKDTYYIVDYDQTLSERCGPLSVKGEFQICPRTAFLETSVDVYLMSINYIYNLVLFNKLL